LGRLLAALQISNEAAGISKVKIRIVIVFIV